MAHRRQPPPGPFPTKLETTVGRPRFLAGLTNPERVTMARSPKKDGTLPVCATPTCVMKQQTYRKRTCFKEKTKTLMEHPDSTHTDSRQPAASVCQRLRPQPSWFDRASQVHLCMGPVWLCVRLLDGSSCWPRTMRAAHTYPGRANETTQSSPTWGERY